MEQCSWNSTSDKCTSNSKLTRPHKNALLTTFKKAFIHRYTRLPFRESSAPCIFQATMDQILQSISFTICYLDGILVMARIRQNTSKHWKRSNIDYRIMVSYFVQISVIFYSSARNIQDTKLIVLEPPHYYKDQSDSRCSIPKNLSELKSFLGLLNYYGHFLPNHSSMIQPLNQSQSRSQKWVRPPACQQIFDRLLKL